MSRAERRAMVTRSHPGLSLSRQCRLLSIGRSSLYDTPKGESAESLALMQRIGSSPGQSSNAPDGASGDLPGATHQ